MSAPTEAVASKPVVHGLQMMIMCIPEIWLCHCGASFFRRSLFTAHLEETGKGIEKP